MRNYLIKILFICLTRVVFCQEYTITGEILSESTKEPVVGATIFFDGTSIGTITDIDGKFSLSTERKINTPLIIRSLGFESVSLPEMETTFFRVFLKDSPLELAGVTLEADSWSRAKKMKIFRREFLGFGNHRCKIKNESDLRLYYNKTKKILYAFSDNPIVIENQKLGYIITYYLKDFEVELFEKSTDENAVKQLLYAGYSQFENKSSKALRSVDKRRKKAYFGSKLHFFRAFYSNRLRKEKFQFYHKGRITPFKNIFAVKTVENILFVYPKVKKIGILFDDFRQSFIQLETKEFVIDYYGNHSPPNDVLFGGEMGKSRVGDMLPINYEIN